MVWTSLLGLELRELRFVIHLEDNDRIWNIMDVEMREMVSRLILGLSTCIPGPMRLRFTKRCFIERDLT